MHFLNYMQGIQIEGTIRYLLFNDKEEKQKKYADKYGEKLKGSSSVADIPEVYYIQPSVLFNKPIRLSDTAGFGGTKGKKFYEKKVKGIQKLFEDQTFERL